MDERESGRSVKLEDPSGYTIKNMADDVEAIRQPLELGPVNLLGHSLGGVVAQAYAPKYANNLSHFILANTFDNTGELNQIWDELKKKIDPEHLRRIEELEKEGLFDKGKPWERGRYSAEYAAWRLAGVTIPYWGVIGLRT